MKLYDYTRAPNPRRVRIFAAEKGIDLPRVQVDLMNGEQLSAEFRRRNPECTVPVLELDDGSCISEVHAICDYLEQTCPEPPLIGDEARARAEVLMWNSKIEQQGFAALADLLRNSLAGFKSRAVTGPADFEQIPELAERGRQRALLFFKRLDSHLEGRNFIANERISLADITALVSVDFARWSKLEPLDSAPNLERWYQAMAARPSANA